MRRKRECRAFAWGYYIMKWNFYLKKNSIRIKIMHFILYLTFNSTIKTLKVTYFRCPYWRGETREFFFLWMCVVQGDFVETWKWTRWTQRSIAEVSVLYHAVENTRNTTERPAFAVEAYFWSNCSSRSFWVDIPWAPLIVLWFFSNANTSKQRFLNIAHKPYYLSGNMSNFGGHVGRTGELWEQGNRLNTCRMLVTTFKIFCLKVLDYMV